MADLSFQNSKFVSFTRHIWKYDQGNYESLHHKAALFDWDHIKDNGIYTYANNLNTTVTTLAKECIPI